MPGSTAHSEDTRSELDSERRGDVSGLMDGERNLESPPESADPSTKQMLSTMMAEMETFKAKRDADRETSRELYMQLQRSLTASHRPSQVTPAGSLPAVPLAEVGRRGDVNPSFREGTEPF